MSEEEAINFNSDKAAQRTSQMWAQLGEDIAKGLKDMAMNDPVQAIRDACCAEACFWKATGEADTHDVKDVLAFPSKLSESELSSGQGK